MTIDSRCKKLHIPFKFEKLDYENLDLKVVLRRLDANWLAIERWSEDLINHCICDCVSGSSSLIFIWDCGFSAINIAQDFNLVQFTVTPVTPEAGGDVVLDLQVNSITVDTITIPASSTTPVTHSISAPVTSSQPIEISLDSIFGPGADWGIVVTADISGVDQSTTGPGCG